MKKIFSLMIFVFLLVTIAYAERLIVFEDQYLKVALSKTINKASIKEIRKSSAGFRVIDADPQVLKQNGVKFLVDKKIFRKAMVPNDPKFGSQWGLTRNNVTSLWDRRGYSCTNITVGVLDTGIDYYHEDFDYSLIIKGYDFAYDDNDPYDNDHIVLDNGSIKKTKHGTMVSGIIGAAINNSKGIAGVCNVKILAVKVLDDNGDGYVSDVYDGVIYAVNNNAKILNLSMETNGTQVTTEDTNFFKNAFTYAQNRGVIVVVPSGNSNYNLNQDNITVLPASLRKSFANVISVGSTNWSDNVSYFSNYGSLSVDLLAPGEHIVSTQHFENNTSYYDTQDGTSFSAPFVAGVVAHMLSANPNLSYDDIRARLINAVDKVGNLAGYALADGVLDASKVLDAPQRPIIYGANNINPAVNTQVTLYGDFTYISSLLWNGYSVSFTKDNNTQIRFNVGHPSNGKNYGVVVAVNGYGRSNEVYIPVVSSSSDSGGESTSDNSSHHHGGGGGGCFIATAAFGNYLDPHVKVLRDFRDNVLMKYDLGRWFVKEYYKYSPPVADMIRNSELLKGVVRLMLMPLIFVISYSYLSLLLIFASVGFFIWFRRGGFAKGR